MRSSPWKYSMGDDEFHHREPARGKCVRFVEEDVRPHGQKPRWVCAASTSRRTIPWSDMVKGGQGAGKRAGPSPSSAWVKRTPEDQLPRGIIAAARGVPRGPQTHREDGAILACLKMTGGRARDVMLIRDGRKTIIPPAVGSGETSYREKHAGRAAHACGGGHPRGCPVEIVPHSDEVEAAEGLPEGAEAVAHGARSRSTAGDETSNEQKRVFA